MPLTQHDLNPVETLGFPGASIDIQRLLDGERYYRGPQIHLLYERSISFFEAKHSTKESPLGSEYEHQIRLDESAYLLRLRE